MDELISRFILQLEEAIIISENSFIKSSKNTINKIYISGMGGSGIAGKFTSSIMDLYGIVPIFTSNNYEIPNWIDENTLVIASSYSGNTEETLSSVNKLKEKGSKIVCITSGGKLLDIAINSGYDLIKLPADWPAPRACFGYSFIAQLFVLNKLNLLTNEISKELSLVIDLLLKERDSIISEAKEISKRLKGKFPFIYSDTIFEPVSIRFKQQMNENAKTLTHHAVIPEMNHNELVGWAEKNDNLGVVFIKSNSYSKKINLRIDLSKEIILNYVDTLIEIESKGESVLQQMFYLVHLTDWISYYVAMEKGVDAMSIDNINYLKDKLAKT